MIRIPHFKLPVGGTPFWELENSGSNGKASGLKSVADRRVMLRQHQYYRSQSAHYSFVVLQSLRQCTQSVYFHDLSSDKSFSS
jgi:hypothetical protein